MRRILTTVPLAAFAFGCGPDLGLPGNIPLGEARQHPVWTHMYQGRFDAGPGIAPVLPAAFRFDRRDWVPWGLPMRLPADATRPIGAIGGVPVLALRWQEQPFDRLFAPSIPGHVQELRPIW